MIIACNPLKKHTLDNILKRMRECIIITAYIEGSIRDILEKDGSAVSRVRDRADNRIANAFVICADAGYDKAKQESISPDILMGDFDSLETELPGDIKTFTFPARKDYTDTGLALKYALDNGYKNVTIVGGIGGRLDHTIANIQDIAGFYKKGLNITIMDLRNALTVLGPGEYSLQDRTQRYVKSVSEDSIRAFQSDEYFSVFAYTEKAVVSIRGAAYPLDHHTIINTYPLGVSNKTEGSTILTVHDGIILLLRCR